MNHKTLDRYLDDVIGSDVDHLEKTLRGKRYYEYEDDCAEAVRQKEKRRGTSKDKQG